MLCLRCSHPLPSRADRCVRCFALNPDNRPPPAPRPARQSGPAAPVSLSIASDPPAGPMAISFDDERVPSLAPAVTEPEPAPVLTNRFPVPPRARPAPPSEPRVMMPRPAPARVDLPFDLEPERPNEPECSSEPESWVEPQSSVAPHVPDSVPAQPYWTPEPAARRPVRPARASASARLLAWSIDGMLISAATAACIAATLRAGQVRYPFDFVRDTAPLWAALFAVTGIAYSAVLTALCGRTPGMALAGYHLESLHGGAPTPREALVRAALALPSAALGLLGFSLVLFDRRGQTLHDKLCRCIAIVD